MSIVFTSADFYLIEGFIGNYRLQAIYLIMKMSINFPADALVAATFIIILWHMPRVKYLITPT